MTARGGELLILLLMVVPVWAAPTVPTDIEQPGTQPGEVVAFATNCDSCHHSTDTKPEHQFLPARGWHGSMMSHAMRDPLFWATVAVAEQDFLPNSDPDLRGGVGDLCLRCHGPSAWLGGRSTPTDGSTVTGTDERGVECEFCHLLVNPDQPVNVLGTTEQQVAPYEAFDPDTGAGYHGSAQYVLNSEGTRLGPYTDAAANHQFYPSAYHRSADLCGTCHDVSNPAVGDLAPNNGAQVPLESGFSGVPGTSVTGKAAFNHPPHAYGVVERTFSEWKVSALDTLAVADFATVLPPDLQTPGGALQIAHAKATAVRPDGKYVDGTARTFTCQTCHMPPVTGKGCNKNNAPVRADLPWHDQTGAGYWMPDAIKWQADHGTLRFGTLDAIQRDAMTAGQQRAREMLQSAALLDAQQSGNQLLVRVTNLTGHKLISGYPEGRRMWLHVRWLDGAGGLLAETGGYGPIGRTVNDRGGTPHQVQSILDLDNAVVYEAKPGIEQAWAAALVALGYDGAMPLAYDRLTDAVEETLGGLASDEPGSTEHTFHFVLNNVVTHDNRIPPFGFNYTEARARNTLPVPEDLYDADHDGLYDYWAEESFEIPPGAATAEVELLYQQTSWEYIQFLWLTNDGLNAFLGQEGVNLLDAWLNTGMSQPLTLASDSLPLEALHGVPGEASSAAAPDEQMTAALNAVSGAIDIAYTPACDAESHTVYYGNLADVATYAYAGAACDLGLSGTASFDPGPGSFFFVIVGEDGVEEGSYGAASNGLERPEDTTTSVCDRPQDLDGVVCE